MPKIIHRIFFNFNDGPDPFLSLLETWKRELPDFEIKMWDKKNLPLDLNEYTRTLAAEKNHAYLADYFRCWLLEKYGGVYLDADIEILDGNVFRAIYDSAQTDPEADLFIGVESVKNGKLTAHSMGVKDGTFHPLLKFLMNLYESAFSGPLHYAIKNFDMPYLMSLYFLDKERKGVQSVSVDGRFKGHEEILTVDRARIFPPSYFSPLTTRNGKMVVSSFGKKTCLCHHFAATWRDEFKGLKNAKCFEEALRDGDYSVYPELVPLVHERYPAMRINDVRPQWRLHEREIMKLEKILNAIVPYGSIQYKILKKNKKAHD